jgi:hypothetical protein
MRNIKSFLLAHMRTHTREREREGERERERERAVNEIGEKEK